MFCRVGLCSVALGYVEWRSVIWSCFAEKRHRHKFFFRESLPAQIFFPGIATGTNFFFPGIATGTIFFSWNRHRHNFFFPGNTAGTIFFPREHRRHNFFSVEEVVGWKRSAQPSFERRSASLEVGAHKESHAVVDVDRHEAVFVGAHDLSDVDAWDELPELPAERDLRRPPAPTVQAADLVEVVLVECVH